MALLKEEKTKSENLEEPEFLKEIDLGHPLFQEVEPEYRFWLSDGREIKNIDELIKALKTMRQEVFEYHMNKQKNDFSNWISDVLKDKELAEKIRHVGKKEVMAKIIEQRKQRTIEKEETNKMLNDQTKNEIEQAIKEIKEQSPLERKIKITKIKPKKTISKINIDPHNELPAAKEPLELPKANEETPIDKIKNIEKRIMQSHTMQKLTELRERVGLKPFTLKQEEKPEVQKTKVMVKSTKIQDDSQTLKIKEREKEIYEKEQMIKEEENKLNERRLELSKMRIELIKARNELEQEKFEQFMKKKAHIEERLLKEIKEKTNGQEGTKLPEIKDIENSDIRTQLFEAKQKLQIGKTNEAKQQLKTIKALLTTTVMNPIQRKKIEYEILELEADVKLAMMEMM